MKKHGKPNHPVLSDADRSLFRSAVPDIRPITPHGRALPIAPNPPPVPLSRLRDERMVIAESLLDPVRWDVDTENGDELAYLRPGLARHTLRKLRRGEWITQAELDLHGLNRASAKLELADFLHQCLRRQMRCVRIIHGKGLGSKNREPILKLHVRHWLTQREEVLAFVQARPVDGGAGAVMVLLRST